MIALTGITGQPGHYVLQDLLKTVPTSQIVAIVCNPAKIQSFGRQGVVVHQADYSDETALAAALQGADKLLLTFSNEIDQRAVQHRNIISAAKAAGVTPIAYTSPLCADTLPLGLAAEHIETEQMLADSGVAYALLCNGWYTENYLTSAPPALERSVFTGTAGEGKTTSATRAGYATATARVITGEGHERKIYELVDDNAWMLSDLAIEPNMRSGENTVYQNLSEADSAAALKSVGLPASLADMLADPDVGASRGGLFDDSHTLSALIGHPTISLAESVKGIL